MFESVDTAPVLNSSSTAPVEKKKQGRPKGKRVLSYHAFDDVDYLGRGGEDSPKGERSSRRRTKTTRFDNDFLDNEEKKLLQQVSELAPVYVSVVTMS